jgi:hypothetical protein
MKNAKKYGQPSNDIISQMFAISYEHGEGFCKGLILKYITRYDKVNQMPLFSRLWFKLNGKGNQADIIKSFDCYNRLQAETPMYKDSRPLKIWYNKLLR